MAMTADENFESDTEEPPFEKITFNTDYKIKTSLEEPPTDLDLKPPPDNLEYVFLEEPSFLHVIISSQLSEENKNKLVFVLKRHKQAFSWKTTDIPEICLSFCKHKIQLLEDKKLVVQKQRRLNPNMQKVIKKEIVKLLDTVVTNERIELVPTRTVTGWFMLAIFYDMIEESVKVFMDDFSVFGSSFDHCLNNLDKMLQRCKDAHLVLNLEKCHFMVKEGIVLGYKVSEASLEVDKAKIKVISKLLPPTNIKSHQRYTITEKELMTVVFAFDKFQSYLVLSKTIMHTDHSVLRHLFKKQDAKPCLIRWILLLQEFDIEIKDKKGIENVVGDHLSRIENDETSDESKTTLTFLEKLSWK
ncbi:reverse transcriptase domain-containing protein [Tanacetum coccineum]